MMEAGLAVSEPEGRMQPTFASRTKALSRRAEAPRPLPIVFEGAPRAGKNRVVWRGPIATPEEIASALRAATGCRVAAIWRRSCGGWQSYLPGVPGAARPAAPPMLIDTNDSLIVDLA